MVQTTQILRTILIAVVLAIFLAISAGALNSLFSEPDTGKLCYLVSNYNLDKYGSNNNLNLEDCWKTFGNWVGDPYSGYCDLNSRDSCSETSGIFENAGFSTIVAILGLLAIVLGRIYIKNPEVSNGFIYGGIIAICTGLATNFDLVFMVLPGLLLLALIWAAYNEAAPITKKTAKKR
jgi:hypothetical protein